MTKIHETFYRENLEKLKILKRLKGEINSNIIKKRTVKNIKQNVLNKDNLTTEISKYLKKYTLKDVVKLISEKNNLPKKENL